MIDFNPPIKERGTNDLLKIVGTPKDWNPEIVKLAETELKIRKVDNEKIKTAKHLSKKREKFKKSKKANESLLWDFIGDPFSTIIVILFSWELKKDGYDRKAKEQKIIRLIIFSIIILILGMIYLDLI
ncbi:hypothetical protein R3X25_11740 [Lutibacter sp. TH_r2]|uniref:hypothetical protein n=1 Tax=Lutibacter sp. TH_r2 TaxID=3082083 RepID=UPI0029554232|nr:hypothetical protein [Lutibacter sp. TH_r2]MDV7187955.1 hypothetical protein [Lutibacter sp. TH_r2]